MLAVLTYADSQPRLKCLGCFQYSKMSKMTRLVISQLLICLLTHKKRKKTKTPTVPEQQLSIAKFDQAVILYPLTLTPIISFQMYFHHSIRESMQPEKTKPLKHNCLKILKYRLFFGVFFLTNWKKFFKCMHTGYTYAGLWLLTPLKATSCINPAST